MGEHSLDDVENFAKLFQPGIQVQVYLQVLHVSWTIPPASQRYDNPQQLVEVEARRYDSLEVGNVRRLLASSRFSIFRYQLVELQGHTSGSLNSCAA